VISRHRGHDVTSTLGIGIILWLAFAASAPPAQGRVSLEPLLAQAGLRGTTQAGPPPRGVFTNRWNRIVVEGNSRLASVNGIKVYLNDAVNWDGRGWTVAAADWTEGVGFRWAARFPAPRRGPPVVLLDPGHGGVDKGAVSRRGVEEKRVTLDVARRVARRLESQGILVRLTRDRDVALSLDARVAIAKRVSPDLFVSLHVNSAPASPSVSGVETFVLTAPGYTSTAGGKSDATVYPGHRYGPLSAFLAHEIQRGMIRQAGVEDRGIKRARFLLLKHVPAPAVLVEMGFLSHPREEAALIERDHRDRLAEGIARGILSYLAAAGRPVVAMTSWSGR
jgi:N-acetylmuramoyl-L-alanine amidase